MRPKERTMLANILGKLRPKSDDAAGLAERLAEVSAQKDSLTLKLEGMEARRGAVLVDGDEGTARAFEAELRSLRDDLERFEAAHETLVTRHAAAVLSERAGAIKADAVALAADAVAVRESIRVEYVQAAERIRGILQAEAAVVTRILALNRRIFDAQTEGLELPVLPALPLPRRALMPNSPIVQGVLGEDVRLPTVEGLSAGFWPPVHPLFATPSQGGLDAA